MSVKETLTRGAVGTVATSLSFAVTTLSAVEQWLRIGSSLVGFAIGVVTLVTMVQKARENKAKARDAGKEPTQ